MRWVGYGPRERVTEMYVRRTGLRSFRVTGEDARVEAREGRYSIERETNNTQTEERKVMYVLRRREKENKREKEVAAPLSDMTNDTRMLISLRNARQRFYNDFLRKQISRVN